MMIVDDKTDVVVGRYYNVRCAVMKRGYDDRIVGVVPILGDKHKDVQFGVNFFHYHVDGRFVSNKDYIDVDKNGRTNNIVMTGKKDDWSAYSDSIVVKRRKCKRLTTGIKPPPKAEKYFSWYDSMVGKSCKGRRCPHLGTSMKEINGELVCPLHNLIGCTKTETIIPFKNKKQ